MKQSPDVTREQRRWITENASCFIRPDAARFYPPGTRLEDIFPALALKYSPNQPRVPAGNSDGGQWTSGSGSGRARIMIGTAGLDGEAEEESEEGAGDWADSNPGFDDPGSYDDRDFAFDDPDSPYTSPSELRPVDAEVSAVNDARVLSDADPETIKPGEQYAQARGRGANPPNDFTPAQTARANIALSRFEESAARIRQIDPSWSPSPNLANSSEGRVLAYEARAREAEARERELIDRQLLYNPDAGGYIVVNRPGRLKASEQREVNANGRRNGCIDCETFEPGTRSGNYIGDHRPASALLEPYLSQRVFPHCVTCSARQGASVTRFLRDRRD